MLQSSRQILSSLPHDNFKAQQFSKGKGPPSQRDAVHSPEETRPIRCEREREHRRQVHNILNEQQPQLLLPSAVERTTDDYSPSSGMSTRDSTRDSICPTVVEVPWQGMPVTVGDEPRLLVLREGGYHPRTLQKLRVTPAVPYPTMRPLRLPG